jgi:methionyl-tRNA formyltransferase
MKFLPRLLDGTASSVAQDETKATYAAKIEKSDACVDFTKSATEIVRLVRAMSPAPGAYALRGEDRVGIAKAHTAEGAAAPGQVTKVSNEGIFVGTGKGLLVIEEVKMPGKRVMPVADYLRGNAFRTEPPFG